MNSVIEYHGRNRPNDPAVIARDGHRTWAQLAAEVQQYARELDALGIVGPVAVLLPPEGSAIALVAACAASRRDVLLLSPENYASGAHEVLADLEGVTVVGIDAGQVVIRWSDRGDLKQPSDPDNPLVYVLTGGSTGRPKCARHTWQSVFGAARDGKAGKRWMCAFQLSHYAGLQALVYSLWTAGVLVLPDDFSAASAWRAIVTRRPDALSCTPTYMRRLLLTGGRSDWLYSSIRHVTMSGEIVDQQLIDSIRFVAPHLTITHVYGSTEAGSLFAVSDMKAGFDASLADGTRMKVHEGQLFVRRSARAMIGYAGEEVPLEEWYPTGDLVEVNSGRVQFLGRLDEMINVGGLKVAPAQVEAVIRSASGVRDVRVTGHRSSVVGSLVKALVAGDKRDAAALAEEVRLRCAEKLPAHMVPRLIEVCDRLDTTATQKIARGGVA